MSRTSEFIRARSLAMSDVDRMERFNLKMWTLIISLLLLFVVIIWLEVLWPIIITEVTGVWQNGKWWIVTVSAYLALAHFRFKFELFDKIWHLIRAFALLMLANLLGGIFLVIIGISDENSAFGITVMTFLIGLLLLDLFKPRQKVT